MTGNEEIYVKALWAIDTKILEVKIRDNKVRLIYGFIHEKSLQWNAVGQCSDLNDKPIPEYNLHLEK